MSLFFFFLKACRKAKQTNKQNKQQQQQKNAIRSVEPLGGSWYSSCPAFFVQLEGETLYTAFKNTSPCSCVCVRVCL